MEPGKITTEIDMHVTMTMVSDARLIDPDVARNQTREWIERVLAAAARERFVLHRDDTVSFEVVPRSCYSYDLRGMTEPAPAPKPRGGHLREVAR